MAIFDFLFTPPHAGRMVGRFESADLIVDTCSCRDGEMPYETAVSHPAYNDRQWVIVAAYRTKAEAEAGHREWVRIMTSQPLADTLQEVCNSEIGRLWAEAGGETKFQRK
jgi:hypothetical protein